VIVRRGRRRVRRLSTTVEPNSQSAGLHQHHHQPQASGEFIRAGADQDGQSCGISVPLTAILYGTAGTVVQVVRRQRVETRRWKPG